MEEENKICPDCGKEECECEEEVCYDCGCNPCKCDDMDTDEIVEHNDLLLNALIELLIDKGVITEDEFSKKVDELEEVWYGEDESEDSESEE